MTNFNNYTDNDKNYLSCSLVYGSIKRDSDRRKYNYHTDKRYHNRVLAQYKSIAKHLEDMVILRLTSIYPTWTHTCTRKQAEEVYEWLINCSDDNFLETIKQVIHATDTAKYIDDRTLLEKLRNKLL